MQRILALLISICMLFALCACGQQAASPDAGKSNGKTILNLWCIATESDASHDAYVKAIEEFNASHDDVEIRWEAYENESYKTKIKAAAAAGELPDIFFTWSGGFIGDFVKGGRAYCLDNAYQAFKDQLPENMLENSTFNGKHYGAPLAMSVSILYANLDILKQVGYDSIPSTYEEFCKCCDALIEKGIIPLGCSGKETWCITQYLETMIIKTIGVDALSDVFYGKATWNNEGISKAAGIMQDMIKKQYFDPDGIALTNDEVRANFAAGKYAFYQNIGNFCRSLYDSKHPDKFIIGELPLIDSTASSFGMFSGGPNDALAVSADSPNAEIAAEAAFELARSITHYGTLSGVGLPTWTPDYDMSSVSPLVADLLEMATGYKGAVISGNTIMSANDANIYLEYVSQLYGGAIDSKEFVKRLTEEIG